MHWHIKNISLHCYKEFKSFYFNVIFIWSLWYSTEVGLVIAVACCFANHYNVFQDLIFVSFLEQPFSHQWKRQYENLQTLHKLLRLLTLHIHLNRACGREEWIWYDPCGHMKLYKSQIGKEKNKSLMTVLGVSKFICKEDCIMHNVSYQRIPVDYKPLDSLCYLTDRITDARASAFLGIWITFQWLHEDN